MALAHEPDFVGSVSEREPLRVPRWTETPIATFSNLTRPAQVIALPLDRPVSRQQWEVGHAQRLAARSIYDMPISPLPAPLVEGLGVAVQPRLDTGAVVLAFVRSDADTAEGSPIDYRPLWVAGAFVAASLCASATVGASWFQVEPAQATSMLQRIASDANALIGITGITSLAAVVSVALLLVGAQRTR